MFSFLSQGPLGELLAPVKSPQQQLHAAIEEHQNDKAMRLINEGVYFNSPDPARDEALPIHTACKAGNQAMVDTLIQMGADVNAKDRSGNQPLHAAAKAGKMDLVKHLIGLGADVAHRNSYRQTAYDVATSHIVRQYLLPLQLRAEPAPAPGTLDAVHNPDKVFDYSNLAPPPTVPTFIPPPAMPPMAPAAAPSGPGQQAGPPPQMPSGGYAKPWSDPAVTRPIAADGFHCSVGNPELAAKYGHIKQDIQIAPPPKLGVGGADGAATASGGPRVAPNPTQYSAFAAYGGRPPPRYVSYNVNNNTSAPFIPTGMMNPALSNPGSAAASPVPPYGAQPAPQQPAYQHQSGYAPSPPLAPTAPQQQPPQQQLPFTPPPPAVPPHVGSVSPPRASPLPPLPPMHSGVPQPPQRPAFTPPPPPPPMPGAAMATAAPKPSIPTLPAPNAVSVFQPDNGEDAVELDG